MKIVTFAEIQKVKSSFEFKNSISSTRYCNEFRFFEARFTSLLNIVKCPEKNWLDKNLIISDVNVHCFVRRYAAVTNETN